MEKIKDSFFRTKIVYTGMFFFLYILYRGYGCPIISYLCGEELEGLVPVLFVAIYYTLILTAKFLIRKLLCTPLEENFKKNLILFEDFFGENLFYITSAMFIYEESDQPYFYIRTTILALIDFTFAFFIFRKRLVFSFNSSKNAYKRYKDVLLWFVSLLIAIIAYLALTYLSRFLWLNLIAG